MFLNRNVPKKSSSLPQDTAFHMSSPDSYLFMFVGVMMCVCTHTNRPSTFFSFSFCKMCLSDDTQTLLSKCVCVHVCPFIDVCEGPSRGAKSKVSGHNWVTGTGDGLKHGKGDAAATLGCLRCQGQSALINRLGPYITALVVLAARSRQALWDFSLVTMQK